MRISAAVALPKEISEKGRSLEKKLLGPLNLESPPKKVPLPASLDENEWENELARNILSLYSNKVIQEMKERQEVEGREERTKRNKSNRIKELVEMGVSASEIEGIVSKENFDTDVRAKSSKSANKSAGSKPTSSSKVVANDIELDEEEESKGRKNVAAPRIPKMIWFGGTGVIQAEWSALEEFAQASPTLRKDLQELEKKGQYRAYIAMVAGLLSSSMRVQVDTKTTALLERMWRQMVVTCNAFGVRCIDQKKYAKALELLERASELAGFEDVISHSLVKELKAFVNDSYAYYYMRRKKPSAALQYITNAMKTHAKRHDWSHVAKCHLHTAVILGKLERHDEAIRCLGQVLSMVSDGMLEVGSNNAQQLLMVSIAYHNIAVEQLVLRHVSEACVSSQNARRLARLCLSYSNRYLAQFESTHKTALKDLGQTVRTKQNSKQAEMFQRLSTDLFE